MTLSSSMARDKCSQHGNTPTRISEVGMSTIDRARAYRGMEQAMALANLTVEAFSHVRSSLRSVGHALDRQFEATTGINR
jgi:hypothetical protein